MPDHGDNYQRMTGPKGEEIGSLGPECGHHCLVQTVGNAHQMIRHCDCNECHGDRAKVIGTFQGIPVVEVPDPSTPAPFDLNDYNTFNGYTHWRGSVRYAKYEGIEYVWDDDEDRWIPND